MLRESEPGKWVAGAGLLVLGVMLVFAGLSLGFEISPFFFILIIMGAYLDYVIIDDQVIKNLRLAKRQSSQKVYKRK